VLANNNPPEAPATNSHNWPGPNRRVAAAAATPLASKASASGDARASIGPNSGSRRCASAVNNSRICSARRPNRRSHPRAVSGCTPAPAATTRRLTPSTWRRHSASPITAARSRRRNNTSAGNNTWVTRHHRQRDRRGRNHRTPPRSRSTRRRANPHGRSPPPQPGHTSLPPTRSRSTSTASLPTINTGASHHQHQGPSPTRPRDRGGPLLQSVGHETVTKTRHDHPTDHHTARDHNQRRLKRNDDQNEWRSTARLDSSGNRGLAQGRRARITGVPARGR
jgi:hypothetical protein